MTKDSCCNCVSIQGKILISPEFHHEYKGVDYFQFYISIKRRSNAEDIIPVMVSEELYKSCNLAIGETVHIEGQYLSYRKRYEKKIFLYVSAKEIFLASDESYENSVVLEGYVINKDINRRTPLGKTVMDVKLAVYRENGKNSYIPCILWGLSDREAERLKNGEKISVVGRVQSREYIKRYEDGKQEKKVAYEISVSKYFRV